MVSSSQNEGKQTNRSNHGGSKVLFVATVYTHLANFHIPHMKLLQEKGYEIHAAASSSLGHREDVAAAGVTCWEIPFARSPYRLANIQAFRRLKALLKKHHFDLIHVHTPMAAFLGRYLAKATGQGSVLYTAHGFHFYWGAPLKNWLIYFTAERIAARWTDGLIVINEEDFESARRLGFQPRKNLFYVHGVGIDLSSYAVSAVAGSVKAALGLKRDDVVVTCVAEFNANKNHGFLLDAWRTLVPRYGNIHLFLVGTGENMAVLQRKVERERIPMVHFLGYRHDVSQIMQETDIATLVSKREGLPKCIMEAMATGKPVVATNVRGSRDLVEDGRTGVLVELGDVPALVKAIEMLVSDPKLGFAMGAAGREKIQDYSLEKVLVEMAGIYDVT